MGDTLFAEIQRINDTVAEMYAKEDFKGMGEFFTEDCQALPPGCDLIKGREGAVKLNESIFRSGFVKATFTAQEVIQMNEDYAVVRGSYSACNEEGFMNDEGKTLGLWKRVDGKWKAQMLISNSNRPSGGVIGSI